MSTAQFELSDPPTDVVSAVKFAPGSSTRLLVSSWDKCVYLYDTHEKEGGRLIRKFEDRAPVLDVCFGKDNNEAFTAGLDWEVKRYESHSISGKSSG
ncbi:mitotic spindle checkpoint protein Bub3 [Cryomyces antarcticus]|uniref:Mitotic spindle checkpoint protein Bub3 n=1 Tax=Cryomyces antarcticus TaxID=329879 RepID=A0ABR0IVS8_9PEZI|nr:mitotic spindle checkpoint protein Bub3 [Cryomyces antarcticus]